MGPWSPLSGSCQFLFERRTAGKATAGRYDAVMNARYSIDIVSALTLHDTEQRPIFRDFCRVFPVSELCRTCYLVCQESPASAYRKPTSYGRAIGRTESARPMVPSLDECGDARPRDPVQHPNSGAAAARKAFVVESFVTLTDVCGRLDVRVGAKDGRDMSECLVSAAANRSHLSASLVRALRMRFVILGIMAATACEAPQVPSAPLTPSSTSMSSSSANAVDAAALDSLARGFASYLGSSPQARQALIALLRDAPARHAIHLASFARAPEAVPLLDAISSRSGLARSRIVELVSSGKGLQLAMPRALDRALWTGDAGVVVLATRLTVKERVERGAGLRAFSSSGDSLQISPWDRASSALLVLQPPDRDFGQDPEGARRAAPKQRRGTVSTPQEDISLMAIQPPPDDSTPSWQQPGGHVLPSGFTWSSCNITPGAVGDADIDGLKDTCEQEVAAAFRPTLLLSQTEWCTGYEPYWAAMPYHWSESPTTMSVFYAVGWYVDCGSPNPGCPSAACAGHTGDSEFIIVDVWYEGNGIWKVKRGTLSAHFGTEVDETVSLYATGLEYSPWDTYLGKIQVWVAKYKHANYASRSRCDRGVYYFDTCDDNNDRGYAAYALPTANVGGRNNQLITWAYSRAGQPGIENLWAQGGTGFYGWQPLSGAGSTQYGTLLRYFGF